MGVPAPELRTLSLCSGVGGLDLGVRLARPGARVACYVERDPYCQRVLAARMRDGALDDAPVWDDLRTFDARPWRGLVDCVVAGYPCQAFSKAGKLRQEADERYLWPEVARVIAECGPGLVFIENVANHLKRGFERVRDELRAVGFRVAAGLFSAAEIAGPFEGQRLFALASAGGPGVARLLSGPHPRPAGPWRWRGEEDLQAVARAPLEPGDRFPQPLLRRVDAGVAHWLDRLEAAGNGVCPAVAAVAWNHLARELLNEE